MPIPETPIDRVARHLDRVLGAAVLGLMVALTAVVIVGVAFRKAGAALVWYDEVASVLLAWLTYYGAAYAALHRAHIGFPRFVQNASPRWRHRMIVMRETVVVAFFAVAAWAGWQVVRITVGTSMVTLPWMPTAVTQSAIPVGAVLFIAAELASLPGVWRGYGLAQEEIEA